MRIPISWTLKNKRERDIFEAGYNCGKVDTQMAYERAQATLRMIERGR